MRPRDGYKWGTCHRCGEHRWMFNGLCLYCKESLRNEQGTRDYYDEPMFYECAMCGMEIVSFETVRGHKYCQTCASIERYG